MVKVCSKCGLEKALSDFSKRTASPDGHAAKCKVCDAEKAKAYGASHRAERVAYNREYRKRNPERFRRHCKASVLKRYYGLTLEDYARMWVFQGGRCKICGQEPAKYGDLHVDHDHRTGKVRGLLCRTCNWMLGSARDKPDTLIAGAKYLKSFEGNEKHV